MASPFERVTTKIDKMDGRGAAHRLKSKIIVSPITEIREGELESAKDELRMLGTNVREGMLGSGIAEFLLIDVLRYLLRGTLPILITGLGKAFLEKTEKPLTENAVLRILTAHAIMTSYPVSADEYFSSRTSRPPMFLYLDKMCSAEEYATFFSLLERVDMPTGASFAPVYGESLLLTDLLESMIKMNATLLAVAADTRGGVHMVTDDHEARRAIAPNVGVGIQPEVQRQEEVDFGTLLRRVSCEVR